MKLDEWWSGLAVWERIACGVVSWVVVLGAQAAAEMNRLALLVVGVPTAVFMAYEGVKLVREAKKTTPSDKSADTSENSQS